MKALWVIGSVILASQPVSAQHGATHHRDHVDYYVTVHNELGEAISVSCNNGTRRTIGVEASRTLIVRGAHDMSEVTCVAYDVHDGSVLRSKHVDIPEGSRKPTLTFAQHDDSH